MSSRPTIRRAGSVRAISVRNPVSLSSSPRNSRPLLTTSSAPADLPTHCVTRCAAVAPAARLSMPTYAIRALCGTSVTTVTTGIRRAVRRPIAAATAGVSGALRTTPWLPRRAMPSSTAISSSCSHASRT